jgi:hypothetical protein
LASEISALLKENVALRERVEQTNPEGERDAVTDAALLELLGYLRDEYRGTNVDVLLQAPFIVLRLPEATYRMGAVRVPLGLNDKLRPLATAAIRFQPRFDLLVEGHTDATPVKRNSRFDDNWRVGFERAAAVTALLEKFRVPAPGLAIVTRGSGLPTGANDRRVEFVFAPKRMGRTVNRSEVKAEKVDVVSPISRKEPQAELASIARPKPEPSPSGKGKPSAEQKSRLPEKRPDNARPPEVPASAQPSPTPAPTGPTQPPPAFGDFGPAPSKSPPTPPQSEKLDADGGDVIELPVITLEAPLPPGDTSPGAELEIVR